MASWLILERTQYFNSQPHKEADDGSEATTGRPVYISTHSLTRRLTSVQNTKLRNENISTHSLTRRLTPAINNELGRIAFQLTASQGG